MESISVTIRKQSIFLLYCRDKTTTSCDRAKGKGGQCRIRSAAADQQPCTVGAGCRFCSAHPVKGNIPGKQLNRHSSKPLGWVKGNIPANSFQPEPPAHRGCRRPWRSWRLSVSREKGKRTLRQYTAARGNRFPAYTFIWRGLRLFRCPLQGVFDAAFRVPFFNHPFRP